MKYIKKCKAHLSIPLTVFAHFAPRQPAKDIMTGKVFTVNNI